MSDSSLLKTVAAWLDESQAAVAFTGAGISTESGIPDFRSPGGVWARYQPVYFDDFLASAEARLDYWRQKSEGHREMADARPNIGHQVLSRWEQDGRLTALITQNIDELHQDAGSVNVLELHGTTRKIGCLDCGERFEAEPLVQAFLQSQQVPECPSCHEGRLKHATISFGQQLDGAVIESCVRYAQQSDLFFALGSSLAVEPAASMPRIARECGARLVIINRDPTPQDPQADAVINAPLGETLAAIDRLLN